MEWSFDTLLNDLIVDIQDIAAELLDFQHYVPEAAAEVPTLVSELYAVSACIRHLQIESTNPRNHRDFRTYSDIIRDVLRATYRTLKDLDYFLRGKDTPSGLPRREQYRLIWEELNCFFEEQSGNTLLDRVGCFKLFLHELKPVLRGRSETRAFNFLHQKIEALLFIQESYVDRFRQLNVGAIAAPTKKVKSWERKLPVPDPPIAPSYARHRPGPSSPISPEGGGRFSGFPFEPERPSSPTLSSSITVGSSAATPPSSVGSAMENHWLRTSFSQARPSTAFADTGTESALFDEHMPGVTTQLHRKDYLDLLYLPFDNGIETRIYVRDTDLKARIFCKQEQRGDRVIACRPVSSLNISRDKSNLHLFRKDQRNRDNVMWLKLSFPSYERLVLFFCAFLALKSSDNSLSHIKLDDHVLKGERHVFSCIIIDDHYHHALQIYKDEHSKGIRLLASVHTGPIKRTPVWTAFINYKISSLEWLKRVESHKIHLGDLPRYVFSSTYTPNLSRNGVPEIHFEKERDVDKFMEVIEDLAEGRL